MLKPYRSSSPHLNPICHFYFRANDSDNNPLFFFTQGYAAPYAAHRYLSDLFTALDKDEDCKIKWISTHRVVVTHTPTSATLTITGELDEFMSYNPTKEESEWTVPYPDSRDITRATKFWYQEIESTPIGPKEPKQRAMPKRHKSQKPSPEGMITVAQIAETLNIAPNKARNLLRKANIEKPQTGWTFQKNDPIIKTITEILKAG